MSWTAILPILVGVAGASVGIATLVTRWWVDGPREKRLEDITEAQYWEPQVKELRRDIEEIKAEAKREVTACTKRIDDLVLKHAADLQAKDRDIAVLERQMTQHLFRIDALEQTVKAQGGTP